MKAISLTGEIPGEQLYWILFIELIFTYLTERLKLEQAEKSLNDLKFEC